MSWHSKILTAVMGVVASTGIAAAADLSVPAAPAPFTWNGFYLGLNAGYAGAKVGETLSAGNGSGSASIPGGIGGAQFGLNYQIGNVVWGFEGDFDGTMATKSITAGISTGSAQIPWIGTFRGRLGYAFDQYLIYATAGGAATQLVSNVNVGAIGSAQTTNTHGGWTAGGGIEAAVNRNLSVRLEYLYVDTGNINVAQVGPPVVTVTGRLQDNLVRAGFNYRFPIAW
jgi:outer membrane immunogenic protein